MKQIKQTVITALFGALISASPAFGQESGQESGHKKTDLSGGYIGIAGGLFYEDLPSGFESDDDAGAFRLYGGYRWETGAAAEISLNGIADLKLDCPGGQQTVERGSVSAVGLYHLPLGEKFSVFPKFGLAYAQVDSGNDACVVYSDDSTIAVVYGGGAEFRATENIAVRADIDKGTSGLDDEQFAWTIGLSFYF